MQTDEILSQSDEAESAKPEIFITAEDNSKERSSKSDYEESLLLPDRLNTVDEVRKVTEIESVAILKSENFQTFLDQSSKVIERALYEDYDILKDYTQDLDLDDSSR
jgi:dynein intermediate chain